jgi:hypothetical protein
MVHALTSPSFLIHPSAWKEESQKFALTEFYEVRLSSILGSSA